MLSRELDYSAVFVVNNGQEKKAIITEYPDASIYVASEYIDENLASLTYENFIGFEKKYSIRSLWNLILSDRFLIDCPHKYVVRIGAGYLSFFEMVFKNEKPNIFFNEPIAVYSSYAAYYVGLAWNVKYLSPMTSRTHDATHHYFLSDPYQLNINFNSKYTQSLASPEYYTQAEKYLQDFEKKSLKPELMVFTGRKPKLPLSSIRALFSFFRGVIKPKEKYDYINRNNYKRQFDSLIFYCRYQLIKRYFTVKEPDLNRKYVFVPLHYQPEASTLVCAPKYEKQLFLVDSLAKSVPADTILYVKEHYALLGHKRVSFYKELTKYPNVCLINPWVDSHVLIKNSEAVVVLTGTAGFESVLYRKPVILLGRIFYENAPGVVTLDDIYGAYSQALAKWKRPSRDEVIAYLAECFRTMYEGCVYTIVPSTLQPENINKVASSILEQINRMNTK
jgi:hypothetical protein